jgi:elongation factor P
MIDVNDLRRGTTFILDGELYKVLEYQHHKPGRGNAIIRTKLATLETGLEILVPLFVQAGDTVRVDTRTGEYVTRV